MGDGAQRVLQLDHPRRSGVMELLMSAVPWLPEGHLCTGPQVIHTS